MNLSFSNNHVLAALDGDLEVWAQRCHEASLRIVRHESAPANARVARGWCEGVRSQHSWVVLGDPYDPDVEIIDATVWSYKPDEDVPYLYRGHRSKLDTKYAPHGEGSIWAAGCPECGDGPPITLGGLSTEALTFLAVIAKTNGKPLDRKAWGTLLRGPVGGWPAKEIVAAAYADDRLQQLIPIDLVGMLTDLNPDGLYMRGGRLEVDADVIESQ